MIATSSLAARLFTIAALFAAVFAAAPQARADENAAGQFIQTSIDEGIAILSDTSTSDADRRSKFRDFVIAHTDVRRIALFTLGKFRRDASPAEIDEFVEAFRTYAIAVYESRLGKYTGQTIAVTQKVERKPGDYVISGEVRNGSGEPFRVAFRVIEAEGRMMIVDLQVEGVWLSIDQQSQFSSFLTNNGGEIPDLSAHLRQQADTLRNGG